jgi:hypothetical protein
MKFINNSIQLIIETFKLKQLLKHDNENKLRRRIKYFLLLLSMALVFFFYNSEEKKYPSAKGKTITFILIDGLIYDIFIEELKKGNLQNINRLKEKSTYTDHGISAFPTMTGYAFYPFITGEDAVNSGVLGLRWFDKKRTNGKFRNYVGRTNVQMNQDVNPNIKNLFQLSDSFYTASINCYMNKGVKSNIKTGYTHTTAKFEGRWWVSDLRKIPIVGKYLASNHYDHEYEATNIAIQQLPKNPKVQWITYPSLDAYNHVNGTNSSYNQLLHFLNQEIGRILEAIKSLNQQNDRAIYIISDHGVEDVMKNIDMVQELQQRGLNTKRGKSVILYSTDLKDENHDDLDGWFVINGNLGGYLYLKEDNKWKAKIMGTKLRNYKNNIGRTLNVCDTVLSIPGIDMISYQENINTVVVQTKKGKAEITKRSDSLSYQVIEGNDPLGYDHLKFQTASEKTWIDSTLHTNYPASVKRLYDLGIKEKVGDLIILSAEGFDVASNYEMFVGNYKGGHGGLRKKMITVPYILYEPNKPASVVNFLLAEEVGKMAKQYLGFK